MFSFKVVRHNDDYAALFAVGEDGTPYGQFQFERERYGDDRYVEQPPRESDEWRELGTNERAPHYVEAMLNRANIRAQIDRLVLEAKRAALRDAAEQIGV